MLDRALQDAVVAVVTGVRPVERIYLYGSRARGDARDSSDVDLAIVGSAWTSTDCNTAHDRLEHEIPTALKFDVIVLGEDTDAELAERVLRDGVVIYESR